MKKKRKLFVCMLVTMSLSACFRKKDDASVITDNTDIGVPYTIICDSFEEAVKIAGFSFTYPEKIVDYSDPYFEAVEDEMIQITYEGKESDSIVIRASNNENEDISGDVTNYASVSISRFITSKQDADVTEECVVTYKGDLDDSIHVATWSYKGLSYSITSYSGMRFEDMADLVTKQMGIEIYGME